MLASLISWTIRLSLLCYLAALLGELTPTSGFLRRHVRGFWTAGCLFFLSHFLAALQHHGWSHRSIYADTARRTEALMGWSFGAGIYFSYLFALLWTADVVWSWARPGSYQTRAPWLGWSVHAYIFFILFNGAVVFETGVTRPVGLVASLVLAGLLVLRVGSRLPHKAIP